MIEALRQVENPYYRAALFRRTFPELSQSGGLIDRSRMLYPGCEGKYKRNWWDFPSGARITFSYMMRDVDRLRFQGGQFAYVGFDELTHFSEQQYLYLFSRNRATEGSGLRCCVRAGTNPGGPGHAWVKRRWAAWLDKSHPNPARSGELRYYARVDDRDTEVSPHHPDAKSRTFIPAFVRDNPYLAGTDYERNLRLLPLVERKRLLDGDWDIMAAAGNVFRREWFKIVQAVPADAKTVRFWDLAATEKETQKADPDFTAGARVSLKDGIYFIERVERAQVRWHGVKQLVGQAAILDGRAVPIGIEQEPGAAGKLIIAEFVTLPELIGYVVRGYPAVRDKITNANPWASQAEQGNVKIVAGDWDIQGFLDESEMFPDGPNDDRVDAVSGCIRMLSESKPKPAQAQKEISIEQYRRAGRRLDRRRSRR